MNLVARNLNNVVFVLDLSQPASLVLVTQNIKQFISRGIPVRFGLVPLVSSSDSPNSITTEMAQVVWYLVDKIGRGQAIKFLHDVSCSHYHPMSPDRCSSVVCGQTDSRSFPD